jgi:hypothetical protein
MNTGIIFIHFCSNLTQMRSHIFKMASLLIMIMVVVATLYLNVLINCKDSPQKINNCTYLYKLQYSKPVNIHVKICNSTSNPSLNFYTYDHFNKPTSYGIVIPLKSIKHSLLILRLASDMCLLQKNSFVDHDNPILIGKFLKTNTSNVRIHLIKENGVNLISIRRFVNNDESKQGIIVTLTELNQLTQIIGNKHGHNHTTEATATTPK